MLAILFYVGDQTFAIDCQYILEVIPLINIQNISQIGGLSAGVINFVGSPVTVFDFSRLIEDRPSLELLTTRILIISVDGRAQNSTISSSCFGIIVEKAIQLIEIQSENFSSAAFNPTGNNLLSGFVTLNGKTIQLVDIKKLYSSLKVECHDDTT